MSLRSHHLSSLPEGGPAFTCSRNLFAPCPRACMHAWKATLLTRAKKMHPRGLQTKYMGYSMPLPPPPREKQSTARRACVVGSCRLRTPAPNASNAAPAPLPLNLAAQQPLI